MEQTKIKKEIIKRGMALALKILNIPTDWIKVKYVTNKAFAVKGIASAFQKDTYTILYNMDEMNQMDELNIISITFHECRHVYQSLVAEDGTLHLPNDEPIEKIKVWKKELKNYSSPQTGDLASYGKQDIEIDAYAFQKFLMNKIFNVKVELVPEIEFLTIQKIKQFEKKYL